MNTCSKLFRLFVVISPFVIASCGGGGGGGSTGPPNPPDPRVSVTLSVSPAVVDYDESAMLTWNSSGAMSCTATQGPGFSGAKPMNGSETTSNLTEDATFALQCNGPGGTDNDLASVLVSPPPVLAQCEDGADNDGDGLTDFPSDPGCSDASDNDETDLPPPPPVVDTDDDGIPDDIDNCPVDRNEVQTDTDGDGIGDKCETEVAFVNVTPNVVPVDELTATSFVVEISLPGLGADQIFARRQIQLDDPSPDVPRIRARDNGVEADKVAGDGIFTAIIDNVPSTPLRYYTQINGGSDSFGINIETEDASGNSLSLFGYPSGYRIGVVSNGALVVPIQVSDNVFVTSHAINVVIPDFDKGAIGSGTFVRDVAEAVLAVYPDVFDSLAIFDAGRNRNRTTAGAFASSLRYTASGIGIEAPDNPPEKVFGISERLTSFTYHFTGDHVAGAYLHEKGHEWCCHYNQAPLDPADLTLHWYHSDIIDPLTGKVPIEKDQNGDYRWKGIVSSENRAYYSDITLYLMGLMAPVDVSLHAFIIRGADVSSISDGKIIPRSDVQEFTIQDIVGQYGARQPTYVESQKDFRVAFVVVSGKPVSTARLSIVDVAAQHYASNQEAVVLSHLTTIPPSFSSATRGRATMATRLPSPIN